MKYIIPISTIILIVLNIVFAIRKYRAVSIQTSQPTLNSASHYQSYTTFASLRGMYFSEMPTYNYYCIDERYFDIFNKYVKTVSTLTDEIFGLERALSVLEGYIDSSEISDTELDTKLCDLMNTVILITSQLDPIVGFFTEDSAIPQADSVTRVAVNPTMVYRYVTTINTLYRLSETHYLLNYRLNKKIEKLHNRHSVIYKILNNNMIYFYYVGLFGSVSVLNEKLIGYNHE